MKSVINSAYVAALVVVAIGAAADRILAPRGWLAIVALWAGALACGFVIDGIVSRVWKARDA